MKRGDLVVVALPGDYKKPRPAVIIESDLLAPTEYVLLCPTTTMIREDVALRRVLVQPTRENGLREISQVQADKIHVIARGKCIGPIGRLAAPDMEKLDGSLTLVLGLLDRSGRSRSDADELG